MFNERMIYLNKSTTKFAVVGIHPVKFTPGVNICDRASGNHFGLSSEEYASFMSKIQSRGDKKSADEYIEDTTPGIQVERYSKDTWKITVVEGAFRNTMVIHNSTLDKMTAVDTCIREEMVRRMRQGEDYRSVMAKIRADTVDMDAKQITDFLFNIRPKSLISSKSTTQQQLALDLIFHREYFITLPEYDEGFYRRYLLKF